MFQFQYGGRAFQITVDEPHFDASNADRFLEEFDSHCPDVIGSVDIDFTSVEVIDSMGVGALLNIRKRIRPPTPLALKTTCPSVLGIIRTMRLHRVFELEDGLLARLADTRYLSRGLGV
jgi:anti-anti-sigma regulatory factor